MEKILLVAMDVLVLMALGFTMYYMRKMTTHIKVIREGKTELQQLLSQLNIHISNAQAAIEGMKKLSDEKARVLQKQIDTAGSVADELQFIQKAADNVAQRLEKLTGQATAGKKDEDAPRPASAAPAAPQGRHVSKAERALAEALSARRNTTQAGE